MICGTAYGVILNDANERAALAGTMATAPYTNPPIAPVMYIKPRNCIVRSGSTVDLSDLANVTVAATLALTFARETSNAKQADALTGVCSVRLALDISEPHSSYYRPAIKERCRDGFLPLGDTSVFSLGVASGEIVTLIDGIERHRWNMKRLVRRIDELVVDITEFMTFMPGDLLLVGLAGDAPVATPGQLISVRCEGLSPLDVTLAAEGAK